MKSNRLLLLVFSMLFLGHLLCAQGSLEVNKHLESAAKGYVVYRAKTPLVIDGNAKEPDWSRVKWIDDFADIEGDKKPAPLYSTRVKMLYDSAALYILAELQEPHIWATYDTRDMIIYHENDIEIFIDPDSDTHDYFEYELNAKNTLLDLKMPMPYRNGGKADIHWNSAGFQSAVSIDGTLNDPADQDKNWTVEMKIPFADLEIQPMPAVGQTWKVNFSRVEWRTQFIGGKYQKIKDPSTGRAFPEFNWVWNPTGLINMHYPERWGMIQFSEKRAGNGAADFKMPEDEAARQYLWLVYYRQQDFKRKDGCYAPRMEDLDISPPTLTDIPSISLEATTDQFTAGLKTKQGDLLTINETGLIRKTKTKDQ